MLLEVPVPFCKVKIDGGLGGGGSRLCSEMPAQTGTVGGRRRHRRA
jgi:hypothetical protein